MDNGVKQRTAIKLTILAMVTILLALLGMAIMEVDTKIEVGDRVHSKTNLSTVYYDNVHGFLGRMRDKNTITSVSKDYTVQFINKQLAGSCSNDTSLPLVYTYSVEDTTGHTISGNVSVSIKWLEVEAGYTFQDISTVTHKLEVTVPSQKTVVIYRRDISVMQHVFNVNVQPEVYVLWYESGVWEWVNDTNRDAVRGKQKVNEYNGYNLIIEELDIIY